MKKKFFIGLLVCLPLIAVSTVAFLFFAPDFSEKNGKSTYLFIHKNADFQTIIDSLKTQKSPEWISGFSLAARFTGYSQKIKSGRYELKAGESSFSLLDRLRKGQQSPVRLTFNNIRTKEQLCERLAAQLMFETADLEKLLNDSAFLSKYGLNRYNAVSLFIPNTYEVYWNISPERLIERMAKEHTAFWTDKRLTKAKDINLSPSEVSTLASIVEEESNLASEKPTIAGLYLNRLRVKMPLQADPTVKFAIGDFSIKRVLTKHINATVSSPYNTYEHTGLPPGQIRIPSAASIDAVLNYKPNPYFYMCAKSNGEYGHDFAISYNEHLQNSNKYHQSLNARGIK